MTAKRAWVAGAALVALLAPLVASAAVNNMDDVLRVLERLISWIFTILLVLATLVTLYAAFLYMSSSGDPEKIRTATHTLLYVVIGAVVALVSRGVISLTKQLVQ